jgi:hypothetical protein
MSATTFFKGMTLTFVQIIISVAVSFILLIYGYPLVFFTVFMLGVGLSPTWFAIAIIYDERGLSKKEKKTENKEAK